MIGSYNFYLNYTIATSSKWTENNNQRHQCQPQRRLNNQPKPKRAQNSHSKRACHKMTSVLKAQATCHLSNSKSCRSIR